MVATLLLGLSGPAGAFYGMPMALEQEIASARKDGISITDEDLSHALPTLLDHINFVGKFDLDMGRELPFVKTACG